MKEEWLMPGAIVPVDIDTTKALVDEIKRLIGVIGGMALQPAAPVQELERLRDENERLHVENRRLIDRIETMDVPVGVGGFLTTTNAAQRPVAEPHKWVNATTWVGLTDEEIALVCGECAASAHNWDDISFARAIEAKLKEKNNE